MKEQKQRDAEEARRMGRDIGWPYRRREAETHIFEKRIEERERMEKRFEERGQKLQRLTQAKETGQNIVLDLEFSHLMTHSEIHSLVQHVFFFSTK
ncbi:hypothetical protein CRYUN_Cryun32bG0014100 [Craigia yunnanensis]